MFYENTNETMQRRRKLMVHAIWDQPWADDVDCFYRFFFLLFKFSFKSELLGKLEGLLDQAWVNEQKNKSRVLRLVTREGYKIKQYLYVNLGKGKVLSHCEQRIWRLF